MRGNLGQNARSAILQHLINGTAASRGECLKRMPCRCCRHVQEMVGVLQRKTVNMLKIAGEMGRLEREPIVDADIKGRLR